MTSPLLAREAEAREVLATVLEADYPALAEQARNGLDDPTVPMGEVVEAMLQFATSQRAAIVEECARVAEGYQPGHYGLVEYDNGLPEAEENARDKIATAIRKLKEPTDES